MEEWLDSVRPVLPILLPYGIALGVMFFCALASSSGDTEQPFFTPVDDDE